MNWTPERRIVFGYAIVLVILAVMVFLAFRNANELFVSNRQLVVSNAFLAELDSTLALLVDAETGQRGYVITGEERFLVSYSIALSTINQHVVRLRGHVATSSIQQSYLATLEPLLKARLASVQETVDLRRNLGFEIARDRIATGAGKALMDKIRATVAAMKAEEVTVLERRIDAAAAASRSTAIVFTVLSVMVALSLVSSYYFFRRDLHARTRAATLAAAHTAEIRDLYDHAPCGYHSVDDRGIIVRINETELAWLGYSRDEVVGKFTLADLITPASMKLMADNFVLLKDRGWTKNLEFEMRRKDGSTFYSLLSATAIKDADGKFVRSRSTMFDITDHKRAEAEIHRLNTDLRRRAVELDAVNHELEAFSYSVSHDLRAPLRSLHGFSTALLEDYADIVDEQGKDYLHRIRNAAQRMAILIDDLLNLSRITRAELNRKTVDLSELARAVVDELVAGQPERTVRVEIQPELTVEADPHLLRAALANLIGNAWKFTAKQPDATIMVGAHDNSDERVFFVRDNGAGFDMTYAHKLFGAFQRLHHVDEFEGTGIGLATVQRIIHRHGGRIWAESEVNKGATFYFTLNA